MVRGQGPEGSALFQQGYLRACRDIQGMWGDTEHFRGPCFQILHFCKLICLQCNLGSVGSLFSHLSLQCHQSPNFTQERDISYLPWILIRWISWKGKISREPNKRTIQVFFFPLSYLFLAMLGLCCCTQALSSCTEGGCSSLWCMHISLGCHLLSGSLGFRVHRLQQLWLGASRVWAQ